MYSFIGEHQSIYLLAFTKLSHDNFWTHLAYHHIIWCYHCNQIFFIEKVADEKKGIITEIDR